MNRFIKKKLTKSVTFVACCAILLFNTEFVFTQETITILFTSNLEGKYTVNLENQERTDPMILMGQSVFWETEKDGDLYLDLGNAFYPGVLSKYSYGASVVDYFTFTNCRSSLVSSEDLRLGIESLQLLQKESQTKFVSANILKDGALIFQPYFIEKIKNQPIAFIGLSSKRVIFDVAEKSLYKITVADEKEVMTKIVSDLKQQSVSRIVLLSGLEYQENVELLNAFKELDLVVAGGDNKGGVLNGKVVRIDTEDGRSIVTVPPGKGYCLLTLSLKGGISVAGMEFKQASYHKIENARYKNFQNRVTLWKRQFLQDFDKVLLDFPGKKLSLDYEHIANLLRDRYRGEISIISNNALTPVIKSDSVNYKDILSVINDNYTIYTYRLTGKEIGDVKSFLKNHSMIGFTEENMIQGYAIDPKRTYRVVSTQTGYEGVRKILNRDISYTNTWKTIPEIINDDINGKKVLLKDDYSYLENRFHFLTDISLSFFYERSSIVYRGNTAIPVGEPNESYYKWGIEGQIDFTLYNRYHKFILTPYINYSRQNALLLNNLFRGTFFYGLNLSKIVSPYHKLLVETVLTKVHAAPEPESLDTPEDRAQEELYQKMIRPVTMRQTIGALFAIPHISGKLGTGYEKQVHDPVGPMFFGIEMNLKVSYDFLTYFTYTIDYDSFISFIGEKGTGSDKDYMRSELKNKLSVKIIDTMKLSFKHRWLYYYKMGTRERYSDSQFITSFDLVTDFKI